MKKQSKRVIALFTALLFVAGVATGCGSNTSAQPSSTASESTSAEASTSTSEETTEAEPETITTGPGKVLGNGYVVPTGEIVKIHEESGKKYIYSMSSLYLIPGYDVVYMDDFELQISKAPIATDDGQDAYVALSDLAKIYSPDFAVAEDNGAYTLSHAGLTATIQKDSADVTATNGSFTMSNPVKEIDGVICVPALELMECAFGKYIVRQTTDAWDTSAQADGKYEYDKYERIKDMNVFTISNEDTEGVEGGGAYSNLSAMLNKLRGAKEYGIRSLAFYDDDPRVNKCITTQIYVPTGLYFNPDMELKCMVVFPGAGGTALSYDSTKSGTNAAQTLQLYAEEYGYVLIVVESWINSGQYGDPTGPIGRFPVTNPDDPTNPWGKSQGWLDAIATSGDVVIDTLEYVMDLYPTINPDKVVAFGHSMGSMGTFSMGVNYTDTFAALCGSGGFTEIDYWDVSKIGDKPFLFLGGTEDTNGIDFMFYCIEKLSAMLPNFEYKFVGGVGHGGTWNSYAEMVFQWFEQFVG